MRVSSPGRKTLWSIILLIVILFLCGTAFLIWKQDRSPHEPVWISPSEGAVVSPDGLLASPEGRCLPPLRAPLVPAQRWVLPDDLLKGTVFGRVLVLRNENIDPATAAIMPAALSAAPCWQLAMVRSEEAGFAGSAVRMFSRWAWGKGKKSDATCELQYLSGPLGTSRAEVRWNGKVIAEINARAPKWEVRSARFSIPEDGENRAVLELIDVGPLPPKSDTQPDGFFVAGLRIPQGWKLAPSAIRITVAEQSYLLPAASRSEPVRLWTVGEGTGANPEFIPVGERPQIRLQDAATGTRGKGDLVLPDVEFAIRRNPDGSQEADFRRAICRIAAPDAYEQGSEHPQGRSQTFVFDSPVSGQARFVGRAKGAGEWNVAIDGATIGTGKAGKDPEQWTDIAVDGIPVKAGANRLTITAIRGKTLWDFFALDLMDSSFLLSGAAYSGWPVAPPAARPRKNAPISFDPGMIVQVRGESRVQPRVFGITDHNPPRILDNKALRDTLQAMNLGAIKGPDHIVDDTAPQASIDSLPALDAYYHSTVPLSQYQTMWNEASRGWKRQLREAGRSLALERIAVLSGIPKWAEFPGSKGGHSGVPKDLKLAARMVSGGLETIRPLWPELRMGYLWNEPDSWWRWEKDIIGAGYQGYSDYFRAYLSAVRQELDLRCPGFLLGGPSTYAPPINFVGYSVNLEKWKTWWNPLLRESWRDLNFFDFHAYGFDPRQILANLDVLAAAGEALHGERKRVTMTEVGYAESLIQRAFGIQSEPACWRYRSLPYARYLLAMAAEPDRIWAALYYDLNNHEYGMFRQGGMEPTSMVDVFLALAPMRGEILGSDSQDPAINWMATRSGKTVFLAIVTDERNGGSLPIRLPGGFDGTLEVRRLCLDPALSDVVATTEQVRLVGGKADLAPMPGSLIVVRFDLGDIPAASQVRRVKEIFADQFVEKLDTAQPALRWTLRCEKTASPDEGAVLRISSFGPEAVDNVAFHWNGHPLEVSGAFRSEVEIPVGWISGSNVLEARLRNPESRIPFVLGAASLRLSESVLIGGE